MSKRFNALEEAVIDHDERLEELEETLEEKEKEKFEKLDSAVSKIDELVNAVNNLADANKEKEEHIQALTFLSAFKWSQFKSDKLKDEVKEKRYSEISCPQTISFVYKVTPFSTTKVASSGSVIYTSTGLSSGSLAVNNFTAYPSVVDCVKETISQLEIDKTKKGKIRFKEVPQPKPKVPFEETVAAVVAQPYKFSKTVVYPVYKYIEEQLTLDGKVENYGKKK